EVLLGEVDYRAHGGLNSCIVDEAVDLAPKREGACGVAKHMFGVGDVCHTCFQRTGAREGSQTWCPATARTLAPCEIRRWTMATPRSPVAPVTMMFFPENSMGI